MIKNVLVFAPHPDDETLGCGGTMARRSSEGHEIIVVVLTDGRHAFSEILGIDSDPSPYELRQIRKEETIRAMETLGIPRKNLFFLDFEDGSLEKHRKEAEAMILDIIEEYSPVEVYFPYIKDYHRDHQETNQMVRRCIQKSGLTPMQFQYSIVQKYAKMGPFLERLTDPFRSHVVQVDISEFADLKEKAVREFKSQISIISEKQERPIIEFARVEKFLAKREKFYVDRSN